MWEGRCHPWSLGCIFFLKSMMNKLENSVHGLLLQFCAFKFFWLLQRLECISTCCQVCIWSGFVTSRECKPGVGGGTTGARHGVFLLLWGRWSSAQSLRGRLCVGDGNKPGSSVPLWSPLQLPPWLPLVQVRDGGV